MDYETESKKYTQDKVRIGCYGYICDDIFSKYVDIIMNHEKNLTFEYVKEMNLAPWNTDDVFLKPILREISEIFMSNIYEGIYVSCNNQFIRKNIGDIYRLYEIECYKNHRQTNVNISYNIELRKYEMEHHYMYEMRLDDKQAFIKHLQNNETTEIENFLLNNHLDTIYTKDAVIHTGKLLYFCKSFYDKESNKYATVVLTFGNIPNIYSEMYLMKTELYKQLDIMNNKMSVLESKLNDLLKGQDHSYNPK